MTFASIRHDIRINRPAADVWPRVGAPERLAEWFPGIVKCDVSGTTRVITLGSGMAMPEEILVNDPVRRRFQYRITAPLFPFHRGTIDVVDLGDGTCVVTYATDADPRTMALVISAGSADALQELKRQVEAPAEGEA